MSLSKYASAALLNALFGKTGDFGGLASAPTIMVAVSSTDPTDDGSGITEPSGGAYARVATAASDWGVATAADPSVTSNANAISFPAATADWLGGTGLAYVALFDDASPPNCLASGALDTSKSILDGDTLSFAAGDLSLSLT